MKKTTSLLAAAALALMGLAATSQPASATHNCEMGAPTVSPATTVMGIKDSKTIKISVKVTDCTATQAKNVRVAWWYDGIYDGPANDVLTPTATGNNTYVFRGSMTAKPSEWFNSGAGTQQTFLALTTGTIYETAHQTRNVPDFKVLRAARFGSNFDVTEYKDYTPKKGEYLKMWAPIQRAHWRSDSTGKPVLKYKEYNTKAMVLQFRTPNGSYKTVPSSLFGSEWVYSGSYTYVKATGDGCYRVVFKTNSTTGPVTSNADCVNIR